MKKLGLQCCDCPLVVETIEEAEAHELEFASDDEPHGGWDTIRWDETNPLPYLQHLANDEETLAFERFSRPAFPNEY